MKTKNELTQEIVRLTTYIQENYPALYEHLDENPVTIPNEADPNIDSEELSGYLEGMIQELRKMIENNEGVARNKMANPIKTPKELSRAEGPEFES